MCTALLELENTEQILCNDRLFGLPRGQQAMMRHGSSWSTAQLGATEQRRPEETSYSMAVYTWF